MDGRSPPPPQKISLTNTQPMVGFELRTSPLLVLQSNHHAYRVVLLSLIELRLPCANVNHKTAFESHNGSHIKGLAATLGFCDWLGHNGVENGSHVFILVEGATIGWGVHFIVAGNTG